VASKSRRRLLLTAATALGLGVPALTLPRSSVADMVSAEALVQQSTLVINQQSNVYSFNAPGPGTLEVTVDDIVWPVPLSALSVAVTSPSSVLGTMNVNGEMDLTISKAGTYYADVTGKAGGSLDVGLYAVQVTFVPQGTVPLPGSMALLLGGLLSLGAARWWMRNESFMYGV